MKDGVLVGWVDEIGRPVAVAQIYLLPNSETEWGIETQSLSQDSFVLQSEFNGPWRPRKPGVEWKPFPKSATKPAGSKALRLSQMRALVRRFRGNDDFQEKKNDNVLRLLTNPMIRYEDAKNGIIDGALFSFVHGTDPEMLIQIELRAEPETKQQSYFYAIAPMTGYELRAYLDGTEVWHKPRTTSSPETGVFWQRDLRDTKPPSFLQRLLSF